MESILKIGVEGFVFGQGFEEITESGDESVFITNEVAGLPEIRGVRVIGTSHEQVASALQAWRFRSIKELQAVHVFEVESQTALGSVDFESVAIATADSEAAGFEATDATIREMGHELNCVVDFASRNEGVLRRGELADIAIQEHCS